MTDTSWLGLTDTHLIACQGSHRLREEACQAFLTMQDAAKNDGIDMQIVSSFRDFNRQQQIWDAKWAGKRPLYDRSGNLIDPDSLSDEQKLFAILIWSALPGASRHHWGTDLDVYDKKSVDSWPHRFELVAAEYQAAGPCFELHCWLSENADRFGFYRPYEKDRGGVAPEAWHLSYRPLAEHLIQSLDLQILKVQIEASNILGKAHIQANLDEIFSRYTLNGESR